MKRRAYIAAGVIAVLAVAAMIVSASIWPVIGEVETGVTPQYPEIQPHYYSTSPQRIFDEALSVVEESEGWELVSSDATEYRLQAEHSTSFLGLKQDVTIRVEPVTEFVTQVHSRSTSRIGRSDFGQNARNIGTFLAELDERLGAVKFEPGTDKVDDDDGEEAEVDEFDEGGENGDDGQE